MLLAMGKYVDQQVEILKQKHPSYWRFQKYRFIGLY